MSFKKNYQILIGKANTDLKSAEILYKSKDTEIDVEVILFHLQQAVEKYIKSILSYMNIHFSKTHDLLQLLDSINIDLELSNFEIDLISELNEYAVNGRYNYISEIIENLTDYFVIAEKIKNKAEKFTEKNNEE